MGNIKTHLPVKLISGITYTPDADLPGVFSVLEELFSPFELRSTPYDFSRFTDYYAQEMGQELHKMFAVFTSLIRPESLPEIKIKTNNLEHNFAADGKRKVNLDPGYISEAKLILATTKNYTHRIYLDKGVFGDVHLVFTDHRFRIQPWTYPDYCQEEILKLFTGVRQNYLNQLGEQNGNAGD